MIIVGSTGFVGSNLIESVSFNGSFHRLDVKKAYYTNPDILVYAGVTGTKFWANQFPERDREVIDNAKENIRHINAKKVVLISSIDVNATLESNDKYYGKDECSFSGAYGDHRLELEKWVIANCGDYNIVRLPAIYGSNLKKNYIHDLISPIPPMLTKEKFDNMEEIIPNISEAYRLEDDNMYHLLNGYPRLNELREFFIHNDFNAISFTNPNSSFQYYNLAWLWNDICRVIKKNIKVINLVTEPIYSNELFVKIYSEEYPKERTDNIVNYNIKSSYSNEFSGVNGYIYSKDYVMKDLVKYIKKNIYLIKNQNSLNILR